MVSELVYLLLEHVAINDDLEFCLGTCHGRRALNRFLIVLIFDLNKYSTDYSTVLK